MLDRFLATLPNWMIAALAITIGFIVMRISDPPRTICDTQMEIFRDSQKKFLYAGDLPGQLPEVKQGYEACKGDNSPGGCFQYFTQLHKLTVDLGNIPEQCSEKAAEEPQIQEWILKSMSLMVQMAWGERAPASYLQKNGWFDGSEIALFCDLKKGAVRIFGSDAYAQWRETALTNVPDYQRIGREQAWQKNLVSTPCDNYR